MPDNQIEPDLPPLSRHIRVSALHGGRLGKDLADFTPTHVISLLDPALDRSRVPSFGNARWIQHQFNDGDSPIDFPLTPRMVAEVIDFVRPWADDVRAGGDARLIVHCHMGVSHSTATALLALAALRGAGNESRAFKDLLDITEKPWPNINVVRLGDERLGSGGRLLDELERYRTNNPRRLAAYRRLNNRRGHFV